MTIGGEITPEQYEILFGEPPPRPVSPSRSSWPRLSRTIQFTALLIALAAAVLLLGVVADSIVNTAATGQ